MRQLCTWTIELCFTFRQTLSHNTSAGKGVGHKELSAARLEISQDTTLPQLSFLRVGTCISAGNPSVVVLLMTITANRVRNPQWVP